MIHESIAGLAVPVESLRLLSGNPRRGDVEQVAASYERFGQRKPIVALTDGTVIAGNHQLQAARKLGWTHIAVVFVDDDDSTARAFAAADNRLGVLGGYDLDALRDLLNGVNLYGTGFTADDLAQLTPPVPMDDFPIDVDGYDLDDLDDIPIMSDAKETGAGLDARTLKWGYSEATLTADEAEALTRLMDQYRAEYGTDLGFGWYLINNRLRP